MPTIQSAVGILLGTFAVIGKQDKSCLTTIKVYLKNKWECNICLIIKSRKVGFNHL